MNEDAAVRIAPPVFDDVLQRVWEGDAREFRPVRVVVGLLTNRLVQRVAEVDVQLNEVRRRASLEVDHHRDGLGVVLHVFLTNAVLDQLGPHAIWGGPAVGDPLHRVPPELRLARAVELAGSHECRVLRNVALVAQVVARQLVRLGVSIHEGERADRPR